MILNAKGGTVKVRNIDMQYSTFGKGEKVLVVIPGLGDGLRTIKGMTAFLALESRKYAKEYRVYIFSRKNQLEEGCSIRDMARDQVEAMRSLGIKKAHIMGVSQGGMIAQYVAIDYPEIVDKLVLVVTLAKQNPIVQKVLKNWIELGKREDYGRIVIDIFEKSYTKRGRRFCRPFYPIIARVGKPKDFKRFLIEANACVHHNSSSELYKINCPTFVIGGSQDRTVGPKSSLELAKLIKNSKLFIYKGYGHGLYQEAPDFDKRVLRFLRG